MRLLTPDSRLLTILVFLTLIGLTSSAQYPFVLGKDYNLDEAKVSPYTLPDVLFTKGGKRVATAAAWNSVRRGEVLELFTENVFGQMPTKRLDPLYKLIDLDSSALSGKAIRKQIRVYFTQTDTSISMDILLYLPRNKTGRVPVFAGLNFYGNHTVNHDPAILMSARWMMDGQGVVNGRATDSSRGSQASQWDIDALLAHGFGLATLYCGDLEPDNKDGWKTGIRTSLAGPLGIQPSAWCCIGAWAWGLSRLMDYLEQDTAVDFMKVALIGHSRLGKTALWAAASDQRFAIVISNESGEGGAALSKRNFGETIRIINSNFPHWFVAKYKEYNDRADKLPLDQHMLLSLIAPRPLYVASAADDLWSDPKGEFLSAWNAGPVYKLFNEKGINSNAMPGINQPVGDYVHYHIRDGKHDVTAYDWKQYIAFAEKHFKQSK